MNMSLALWPQSHRARAALVNTRQALTREHLTVGFLGGSITDPRPGFNWPEGVSAWLVQRFPEVRVAIENAGIGATGSDLAVFRAERDILGRGCDLVFVEYAVNDGEPTERTLRTREGLVRKLLADEKRDVVFVYTFGQGMYADMLAGRVPGSIAQLETIAEHYGIGSVWMGLHAFEAVRAGLMRWEEWLPDGLHPQLHGGRCYAESVNTYLAQELLGESRPGAASSQQRGAPLPEPLNSQHWQTTRILPWDEIRTRGPWRLARWSHCPWIDQILETAAPGAQLEFTFTGRGVVLAFDFGKTSSEFRWRLDGGDWREEKRERFDWVGDQGWMRPSVLGDDFGAGEHRLEVEVIHGNAVGCRGTNFRLAWVGIVL